MKTFKRITAKEKTIHCYGFDRSQLITAFDPSDRETAKYSFGRFTPDPVSVGISIEPIIGEHAIKAKLGEPIELPDNELQDNSACLFFVRTESIDIFLRQLEIAKKRLRDKIIAAQREGYRRQFCGQVVKFYEWEIAHPDIVRRIRMQEERRLNAAVDAAIFRQSIGTGVRASAVQDGGIV